jgi:hypothetical protein
LYCVRTIATREPESLPAPPGYHGANDEVMHMRHAHPSR